MASLAAAPSSAVILSSKDASAAGTPPLPIAQGGPCSATFPGGCDEANDATPVRTTTRSRCFAYGMISPPLSRDSSSGRPGSALLYTQTLGVGQLVRHIVRRFQRQCSEVDPETPNFRTSTHELRTP